MLLQTNSYIVPKDKRSEHARLMRRFRLALAKLGCDLFEVYEQVGANWNGADNAGRFVQLMRFRDRKHQTAVQNAERSDTAAQALITEFCELVNFPYQQQQGFFAVGFYTGVLSDVTARLPTSTETDASAEMEGAADGITAFDDRSELELAAPVETDAQASSTGHEMEMTQASAPGEGSEAFPDGDLLDLDEPGEPLSEEELARELGEAPPAPAATPAPPPPAPATKGGLFRRASSR